MGLVHAEDPCVADRRPKDIPRQIGQHGVVTVAVVLAEGHPLPLPDACRDVRENGWRCGLQGRAESRGDLAGKDGDRHEELSPSWLPVLAIGSDPTAGDQQVDMGVIAQLAVPGVKHRQHAGQCPEVPFLGTEVLDRRGRDLHQQTVQQLLIATEHLRNSEGTVTTA